VDIEIEFLLDQLGHLAGANGLASNHVLVDKRQYFALQFVRAARTPLPR